MDGKPFPRPAGATFASLFADLRSQLGSQGRALVSVQLDGKEISRSRQDQLADQVPADSARLEIVTADPIQLSLTTLEGLSEQLPDVERLHQRCAELVIAGNYKEALKQLDECFSCWVVLVESVKDSGELLHLEFRKIPVGNATAADLILKVRDALIRFKAAFDGRDVVRIGDISQYELQPLLGEWKQFLRIVCEHARRPPGGGR